jgi:mRNA interferase RelE/StbE
MSYKVIIKKSAKKEIATLPKNVIKRVLMKIKQLADEPRPSGCRKIVGTENTWRIRVGNYRIIYNVFDDVLIIEVIAVKHRKDAYN